MDKKQYWFPARSYGWGWGLPTAWQGWVVYAAFGVLVAVAVIVFPPPSSPIKFAISIAALAVLLVLTCLFKGEPPRWRWGRD